MSEPLYGSIKDSFLFVLIENGTSFVPLYNTTNWFHFSDPGREQYPEVRDLVDAGKNKALISPGLCDERDKLSGRSVGAATAVARAGTMSTRPVGPLVSIASMRKTKEGRK
ncbi:hypothetical protein RRG08_012967 [Elysia crispata]|uniref:Uncharacterized protein n=1 Tax=Elysia crispata TaxID=231223 RepID=A0AAE1DQ26_9GAST|nr:hypothetical protein RRG08_012967 [Elysia crispata]